MARHQGLPRPVPFILSKSALLEGLSRVDANKKAAERILRMESEFRARVRAHVEALPTSEAEFRKFNTNPFVLMFDVPHVQKTVSAYRAD